MRPVVVAVMSGAFGFVAGALGYGWVAARQLDVLHRVVQSEFAVEQEFRAVRAERQGEILAALHHQQNAVEVQSANWLYKTPAWGKPAPWFAMQLAVLKRIEAGINPKGREVAEGIARGHLAWLLEASGHRALAQAEWERAAELARQTGPGQMRELIASLRAQREASPEHRQAEEGILGPDPSAPPRSNRALEPTGAARERSAPAAQRGR